MKEWMSNLFKAIDQKDADKFSTFLREDATFRFANAPVVSGRKNIKTAISGFFSTIKELKHQIFEVWENGDAAICEGEVTYLGANLQKSTFPFVNVFRMKEDLIADYRIYVDISSLSS